MPSRRSDRGEKIKRLPHESDLESTNRKAMTATTLAPLFGLPGLGILAGAAAVHTNVSAKADVAKKNERIEGVFPDDTIIQLTDSILQSAAGRPFNFSISEGKKKKAMAREALMAMMLNGILSPEVTGPLDLEAQLNKFEQEVNVDRAKNKGNPKTVHPATARGNRKAQEKTST